MVADLKWSEKIVFTAAKHHFCTNYKKMNRDYRSQIGKWIDSPKIQKIIIWLILFNAVTIGLDSEGYLHALFGNLFFYLDEVILIVFALELVLKLYVWRFDFFKDGWNSFDFVIVCFSILPSPESFVVLRTLRILRTLRLLKKVPKLRIIIDALIKSIPSIGWIGMLLILVFYVFAVIGTNLFGEAFPEWFGGLGPTMYTLFQVMTLESWSMGIARPVMQKFPYAFLFFIPFILTATYTALNIFIAVVVNAMNEIHNYNETQNPNQKLESGNFILNDNFLLEKKLEKLENDLAEIKEILLQKSSHYELTDKSGETLEKETIN
jgi:voltage-gated sodium channel